MTVAMFSLFPTFSAESKQKKNLRFASLISLHLVLNQNVGKMFALSPISLH